MRHVKMPLVIVFALATTGPAMADDEPSVANLPPVVVMTSPQSGDTSVDPSLTQIRVTFSKEMADQSWSWTQISDESFPKTTGKPHYLPDKRTCVLPIKLEPNRSYVTWLNSAKFGNFRDTEGRSAVPYLLVFETGKGRSWGPEQATGKPDTPEAGDIPTAWASLTEDGQPEWLVLEYAEAVKPVAVHVYETFNPGAVTKVSVFDEGGAERVVWQGTDPTRPGSEKGVSKIPLTAVDDAVKRLKLYIDSPKVPGWNEIDAVGLIDHTGTTHWATKATASSTYAERAALSPFEIRLDSPVRQFELPADTVRVSHVGDASEDKRSLGGSGHAVAFERPTGTSSVVAIQIFASRYGYPQPPDEDFHMYLLDQDREVIKDLTFPYSTVKRTTDMNWVTLPVPAVEVPEKFYVALSFNPHRTKGIYLGLDKNVTQSHSYTGLPASGFTAVADAYDWMVRAYLLPAAANPDE